MQAGQSGESVDTKVARIEAKLDSLTTDLKACKNKAATPAPAPAKKLSFKDQILDLHNAFRCMHNTPYLSWDAELALEAAKVAKKGIYRLSTAKERYLRGQVLGELMSKGAKAELVVRGWYKQKGSTAYGQILWATTKRVGCAEANGIFVCRYAVKGNTAGQYTHNVRALVPSRTEFACMTTAASQRPSPASKSPTQYCGKTWSR